MLIFISLPNSSSIDILFGINNKTDFFSLNYHFHKYVFLIVLFILSYLPLLSLITLRSTSTYKITNAMSGLFFSNFEKSFPRGWIINSKPVIFVDK